MSRLRLARHLLLGGVSAFALPLVAGAATASATGLPPGTALSLEFGGVCPTGDNGTFSSSYTYVLPSPYTGVTASDQTSFGSANCGWTGRIGLFQEKPGSVFGMADYWGIFVRHQDVATSHFGTFGSAVSPAPFFKYFFADIASQGTFEEDRTIVDFEVGKDIGIGGGGSKFRLFGGLRYAHYSSDFSARGGASSGVSYYGLCYFCYTSNFSVRADHSFDGVGPRLGLTAQHPLFGGFFLTGSVSGSLLWGDHQVRLSAIGRALSTRSKFSDGDMVSNAEGEIGVGMPIFASGTLIVGARWEGWFDQAEFRTYTLELFNPCACREGIFTAKGNLDRNNWGPFVRFNLPLGPPP